MEEKRKNQHVRPKNPQNNTAGSNKKLIFTIYLNELLYIIIISF